MAQLASTGGEQRIWAMECLETGISRVKHCVEMMVATSTVAGMRTKKVEREESRTREQRRTILR